MNAKEIPLSPVEIRRLLRHTLAQLRTEPEWTNTVDVLGARPQELSVLFGDDDHMRDFQRRFRKLDRTTDILSFPTREWTEQPHTDSDSVSLGDLVISMPAVIRGAKRGRRSPRLELTEVLIHGCLHLLGFDHVIKAGVPKTHARRMLSLQKTLFRGVRAIIKS